MNSIPPVATTLPPVVQADIRPVAPDPAVLNAILQHPAAPAAGDSPSSRTIAPGKLESVVNEINAFLKSQSSNLEFTHDKASGLDVVRVIDSLTSEVINQYPSEQAVRIAQDLGKLTGTLLREQA